MSTLSQENKYSMHPKFIQQNVSLHDKNWFKTGGLAKYFAQPSNSQEFAQALAFAQQHSLEVCLLGHGANVLISDDGFDGLVICPQTTTITHKLQNETTAHVTSNAGTSFDDLIEYCLNNNLTNLEEFSGIPGTIGGSVYINLHYYEFFLADFLIQAEVIHKETGQIKVVSKDWFNFGYDISSKPYQTLLFQAYLLNG